MTSKDLANALKTAINSVYGLTSASFDNPFRDPRNIDNISELYDNVAKIMGVSDLSKVVYDCRKLSITKKVLDCLYEFYHSENQSDETITTCMLLYGPKADLEGDGYEVEAEDGFVTKGV